MSWCKTHNIAEMDKAALNSISADIPLFTEWSNVGGQIIPDEKLKSLFDSIKSRKINTWQEVHAFYDECQAEYQEWKARYSVWILEQLYTRPIDSFTAEIFTDIKSDVTIVSNYMYESSISSRKKDYTDFFRTITYRNEKEMLEVVGRLEDNSFLKELKKDTETFNSSLEKLFAKIC